MDTDVVGTGAEEVPDLVVEPRGAPRATPGAQQGAALARGALAGPPRAAQPAPVSAFELDFGDGDDGAGTSASRAAAPIPSFGGPMLESDFELFDEGPNSAAAELDFGFDLEPIAGAALAPSPGAASSRGAVPAAGAASLRGRSVRPTPQRSDLPWPVGTTPHPDDLAVDLAGVRQLAGFGDPPGSFLGSPVYALRVALRRRALRSLERDAAAELRRAESARDDVLVEVARECRAQLEANDRYGSLAREFIAHERLIEEHKAALAEAEAGLHALATDIDAQLEAVERERASALEQLQGRERDGAELEAQLSRVAAQAKRLDIERRALLDVARRKLGPQGGELPPEISGPLGELDARTAALAPELAEHQRRVSAGQTRLGEARRELELIDAKARRLSAQKTMQLAERQAERQRRAQVLSEAHSAERAALVAVAQAVLGMKGHVGVDEARLVALRELDARVTRAAERLQQVRLGQHAFDSGAVHNGYVFAAVLVLLVVAAAVLL